MVAVADVRKATGLLTRRHQYDVRTDDDRLVLLWTRIAPDGEGRAEQAQRDADRREDALQLSV
jgi:hypothetical protein